MGKTVEFRGCDNLVFAEVLTDDANGITFGAVRSLAPVAEIAKTVETSSDTHYYDNVGQIIIRSEGSDEITLTVPVLPLDILAAVTGKTYDTNTGAFIDGESVEKYYAIGYRLRLTDGSYRYVWRNKWSFGIPNSTSATENDGTDTNNQRRKTVKDSNFSHLKLLFVTTKIQSLVCLLGWLCIPGGPLRNVAFGP